MRFLAWWVEVFPGALLLPSQGTGNGSLCCGYFISDELTPFPTRNVRRLRAAIVY